MPTNGRVPPFLVVFVLAFAFFGLVISFQIIKERSPVAGASLGEKDFQLKNIEHDLKEQIKATNEREEERDLVQTKLFELARSHQAVLDSLHGKDLELESVKKQHQKIVEELVQLKKIVDQKEGEIVHVREQLQEYYFNKAKESAEQMNTNKVESDLADRHVEERTPADEVGLVDRKRIEEEEEEEEAYKGTDVSDTEQDMYERSKLKADVTVLNEDEKKIFGATETNERDKYDESLKLDAFQDKEAKEQANADTRDPVEKEIDTSQKEDLNEINKTRGRRLVQVNVSNKTRLGRDAKQPRSRRSGWPRAEHVAQ